MEERIIQLESLAALQDETIAKLSAELYRQQQDTFQLQRRLQAVEERLASLKDAEQIAGNEKPPHY
jgi:SlyX protein